MLETLEKFMLAWIPLFVAMDPLGLVPLFLGLTGDLPPAERKKTTVQATWTAAVVAIGFVFLGKSAICGIWIKISGNRSELLSANFADCRRCSDLAGCFSQSFAGNPITCLPRLRPRMLSRVRQNNDYSLEKFLPSWLK
jgi:hypothetical protein